MKTYIQNTKQEKEGGEKFIQLHSSYGDRQFNKLHTI